MALHACAFLSLSSGVVYSIGYTGMAPSSAYIRNMQISLSINTHSFDLLMRATMRSKTMFG